jgi:hypothetical protein
MALTFLWLCQLISLYNTCVARASQPTAACDFDMIFTFVLAGWFGSVHDMRVFDDAMTTYNNVFPHPPIGTHLVFSTFDISN